MYNAPGTKDYKATEQSLLSIVVLYVSGSIYSGNTDQHICAQEIRMDSIRDTGFILVQVRGALCLA